MRLVHLSDLHLGFRAYARLSRGGVNQREVDVARSFGHAVDQTIALEPELVVIGGDVFHQIRPSNTSIKHAYQQFAKLRAGLPTTEIVMVAGNHDTPKVVETGSILGLFASLDIHVVDGPVQTLDFAHLDLSVMAVPDNHHVRPPLTPVGNRRFNVLLLHGEATGISPKGSPAAKKELSAEDLHADAWDYVALGHYHVYREIAPRVFYSGAIDYTTSNIWGERAEETQCGLVAKGIVERDLASGVQTFHALPVSRVVVDLDPIDALELSPDEVDTAIVNAVESIPGGIDGAIVRLIVRDVPVSVARDLDHATLKSYARRALHFQLEKRKPEVKRSEAVMAMHRRAPLSEVLALALGKRPLASDLDRAAFVSMGLDYLDRAGEVKAVISAEELTAPTDVDVAVAA